MIVLVNGLLNDFIGYSDINTVTQLKKWLYYFVDDHTKNWTNTNNKYPVDLDEYSILVFIRNV